MHIRSHTVQLGAGRQEVEAFHAQVAALVAHAQEDRKQALADLQPVFSRWKELKVQGLGFRAAPSFSPNFLSRTRFFRAIPGLGAGLQDPETNGPPKGLILRARPSQETMDLSCTADVVHENWLLISTAVASACALLLHSRVQCLL